jgi:anthranilate synthase component 1
VTGTVRPSADEFLRLAERGNLIPVYRELLADGDTPVSAFSRVGGGEYSFLLESVVGGEKWAAYSFLGCGAPHASLTWAGGRAELHEPRRGSHSWVIDDPVEALHQVLGRYRPVATPGLPRFWGGAVGWIGYDAVRAFEPKLTAGRAGAGELPALHMMLTRLVIIFDNLRQTLKVVVAAHVDDGDDPRRVYDEAVAEVDAFAEKLRASPAELRPLDPPEPGGDAVPEFSGIDEPRFCEMVRAAKEYILAGDVFQVVLAQQIEVDQRGVSPFDLYRALRVINPSPYMFHLTLPGASVIGASPETLVRLDEGRVEVRPIAGTRPRGADAAADVRLAAELSADPKERAEHLMLIDLGRNDVGRVATTGSVEVTQQMEVEHFSHVMHLVSTVSGELAPGRAWPDVLRAAFPAGTLTGAPKIRAMEIIDELEPTGRGLYGGAVGYISYTGNMDLAIAIRTLVARGDAITAGAGAGIVADSVPEAEYAETLNKARAVLRAVELARSDT